MASKFDGVPLTAEEFGFLSGGPVRAAEVAIAELLERGVLRVNRDGELSATGAATGLTRVQTEVVAAVGANAVPLVTVVNAVVSSTSMRALADALRARGLLAKPKRFALRSRGRPVVPSRDHLESANMLPAVMLFTAGGLVATGGYAAYPDEEAADALMSGRAAYSGQFSCSASPTGCGSWGTDGGGSSCGSSGSSCGGGGGSCGGGGGGGGCGGGS